MMAGSPMGMRETVAAIFAGYSASDASRSTMTAPQNIQSRQGVAALGVIRHGEPPAGRRRSGGGPEGAWRHPAARRTVPAVPAGAQMADLCVPAASAQQAVVEIEDGGGRYPLRDGIGGLPSRTGLTRSRGGTNLYVMSTHVGPVFEAAAGHGCLFTTLHTGIDHDRECDAAQKAISTQADLLAVVVPLFLHRLQGHHHRNLCR